MLTATISVNGSLKELQKHHCGGKFLAAGHELRNVRLKNTGPGCFSIDEEIAWRSNR